MKKIFLRRILPVALCILMVLPVLAMNAFAANMSSTGIPGDKSIVGTVRQNWASMGQGYHTSVWNNDRHSKYLNNGTYNHSYQWWEPSAPERPNGAGVDPTKQHFGFTFSDGYYLLDEISIYAHSFDKGYNNIKYTVEALILGEWVQVGVGYQDDAVPTEHGDSIVKLTIPLVHPNAAEGEDVNTNNIRIWCNEYGYYAKRYGKYENNPPSTHDWWLTPKVQEVEIMGYTGYRPLFDVPLNAYLVTNAALSGMIGADSALTAYNPGLAGDEKLTTYWKAMTTGAQNIWAEFNNEYPLSKVGFSIGGCADADVGINLEYNIKILLDGTIENGVWETIVTGATAVTSKEENNISYDLDSTIIAKGMMVEFTKVTKANGSKTRAVTTELLAEIADGGKCIFLADYITAAKKMSTATGNLACYGSAYASSNFNYAGISNVTNIIDGNVGYVDKAWIAENYIAGTYVGVTLKEAHEVTKVVLYFDDVLGGQNGEHVFKFDLQIKVGDTFKTVATATSYDAAAKKYVASIVLPTPEVTDDVRIVFRSDAHTFPYLKEMEIFDNNFIYSSYMSYSLDSSRKMGGPAATTVFGDKTVSVRGKYLDKQSPIEYFNIALEHNVSIDWLAK